MNKTFITLLFVVGIVVLGLYLGSIFSSGPKKEEGKIGFNIKEGGVETSPAGQSTDSSATTVAAGSQSNFYFERKSGEATEIALYDFSQNKARVYFTDKDETQKIKSSIKIDGNIFIGLANKDNPEETDFYNVSLDGKGTKNLVAEKLTSMQTISAAPNKNKLALVSFSNAEKDFGFSLISFDVGSKKQTILTKDPDGIFTPAFINNNEIAFTTSSPAQGKTKPAFALKKINVDSKNLETLLETENKINAFKFTGGNEVLIVEGSKENKIEKCDLSMKKCEEVYSTKSVINSLDRVAPDKLILSLDGQLTILDLNKKETSKLTGGNFVLGV